MNLYCCMIVEQGWGIEHCVQKDYIWATDEIDARETICRLWEIRKNKRGLKIEEVPVVRANMLKKTRGTTKTNIVWNSFLQLKEEVSYYTNETFYICSKCRDEVSYTASNCRHCGALFK